MPLASFLASSTQGDALKKRHVIADLGRFSDYDPHPMIDKETRSNLGRRMDLHAGQPSGELREHAWQNGNTVYLQPVGNPIGQQCMKPRIGENHFQLAGRGRISVKDSLEVLFDLTQHVQNILRRQIDSIKHTACAIIPSSCPTASNPSPLFTFTLTKSGSILATSEIFFCIAERCGPRRGA